MKSIKLVILSIFITLNSFAQTADDTISYDKGVNYELLYNLAIDYLNELREAKGLHPVVKNDSIMRYAKAHAIDMRNKDSLFHDNPPTGEVCTFHYIGNGRTYKLQAKYIIETFHDSYRHWNILMDKNMRSIGLYEAIEDTTIYHPDYLPSEYHHYLSINLHFSVDFGKPKKKVHWPDYTDEDYDTEL